MRDRDGDPFVQSRRANPARGGQSRRPRAEADAARRHPGLRQNEGDGAGIYGSGVLPAKEIELLSIAFDASFTHMYAPGTHRHIKNALTAGASVEEIFEVLKLCVAQGAQAINLGIPILEEELARTSVP